MQSLWLHDRNALTCAVVLCASPSTSENVQGHLQGVPLAFHTEILGATNNARRSVFVLVLRLILGFGDSWI